jgi:uncharacterized protein with HEPN domain
LGHILEAIDKISTYTHEMTFDEFSRDSLTLDAVSRNLGIIGEAAKNIPEDVRSQHDEIPWREILGMRNVLAHGYMTLDMPTIWQTVTEDLPAIRPMLETMLGQTEP